MGADVLGTVVLSPTRDAGVGEAAPPLSLRAGADEA